MTGLPSDVVIPRGWPEVTVDQFIQLKNIDAKDYGSVLSYNMEQLFILTDTHIDDEYWDEMDSSSLMSLFGSMTWLNSQPSTNFKRDIEEYKFKELSTLTVGEFIDLEYWFGKSYVLNLPQICSILYRRHRLNEWNHLVLEPRTYDESERLQYFSELPVTDVFGIIGAYLNYKNQFLKTFENMFEEKDAEDDVDEADLTADERNEMAHEKKLMKWNWERLIYQFGNRDSTKFHEITELPLTFFFNQLAMKTDLQI